MIFQLIIFLFKIKNKKIKSNLIKIVKKKKKKKKNKKFLNKI
jgi:hypothetical protein